MLAGDSDTEFCAQLPLCDTDLGAGAVSDPGDGAGTHDERREDVAVLTSQDGVCGQKSVNANRPEYKSNSWMTQLRKCCRLRQGAVLLLGVFLTVLALTLVVVGGVKSRQPTGIHLVHMQTPVNLKSLMYLGDENFTFVQLMALTNVALDRPANQSSTASPEAEVRDDAIKAVDGNLSSCAMTGGQVAQSKERLSATQSTQHKQILFVSSQTYNNKTGLESRPTWHVDLQKSRVVKSIRIHGANNFNLRNLVIYVTGSTKMTSSNNVCGRVVDLAKGYYTHINCVGRIRGRYVVIELDNPVDSFESLRLCEVMVFSGNS